MRLYMVFSVLFLLSGLVISGCGDRIEESDADVLGPDEDFNAEEVDAAD